MMLLLMTGSCYYDWVAVEEPAPVDPGQEVSFSASILPIFSDHCAGCHKAGGVKPNLTAASAYSQINTAKYINTGSPAQSLIYKAVAPGLSAPGHKTLTASQASLLLAWISQGAKNN
jgi:mono/diheme cytochrome c family protein